VQLGDEPAPCEAYFWHPVLLKKDGFIGWLVRVTALTNLERQSKMKIRYVTIDMKISTFDRAETNSAHVF
jgi:hypothetical protein